VSLAIIVFVAIALTFDFLNGFHDSANVVATAIASRAMAPRWALGMTALANLVGPFLFGVAVAETIGNEVLSSEAVTVPVAMAALISAIVWNLLTWLFGIPSSSSQALMGGFIGAAITGYGLGVVQMGGLYKVVLGLFIRRSLGALAGFRRQTLFGSFMSPRISLFSGALRLTTWL
jgi:PiT family inorganic phosphate transporter